MKQKYLFLLCLLAGINAFAYDAVVDGICYNLSGDEATVTYRDDKDDLYIGSVVIPESFTYNGRTYSVTCVGDSAPFWIAAS